MITNDAKHGISRRQVITSGVAALVGLTAFNRTAESSLPPFDSRNFISKPSKGSQWTLATRLGQMLQMAEQFYGERDKNYTFVGIEFVEDGPQTFFPSSGKHIAIQLGLSALQNYDQACFQLSHEVIHLLSPTGGRNSTNLEEGLATIFSLFYTRNVCKTNWQCNIESYERAATEVTKLLDVSPNIIKYLRIKTPTISHIKAEDILNLYPKFDSKVAEFICKPFVR